MNISQDFEERNMVIMITDVQRPVDVVKPLVSMNVVIGVCLSIGGNVLISIAMNVQKYALTKIQQQNQMLASTGAPSNRTYVTSGVWWIGILLMVFGEGGNFLAYGFGPASVVAPLGTTTVVVNAYISRCMGERLRCQDVLGTLIIAIGACMIILFSSQEDKQLSAAEIIDRLSALPFMLYIVLEFVLLLVLLVLKYGRGYSHILLHLLPAAILGSFTVLGAKACSMLIALAVLQGQLNELSSPIFYIMLIVVIITGILQIRLVTGALQENDASVVVPVFFVFFTISAILVGVFFYGEFDGVQSVLVFLFLFGCTCSFVGVFMITNGREAHDDDNDEYVTIGNDMTDEDSDAASASSPLIPPPTRMYLIQPQQKDYRGEIDALSDSSAEERGTEMQDMSNLPRDSSSWPSNMDNGNPKDVCDMDRTLTKRKTTSATDSD